MILMTFVVFVVLRMLIPYKGRPRESLGVAVRGELIGFLVTFAVLLGAFLIVLCFTLFFGPIPPIHEWGTG